MKQDATRAGASGHEQNVLAPGQDAGLAALVESVAAALTSRGQTLGTAESCTGGWISKCCTDLSGSSTWFNGGLVSYSNPAKVALLGVSEEALLRQGAVSARVAEEMADGAQRALDVTWAIAVTGVAGPGGGTPDKPVGCVWVAWSGPGRQSSRRYDFPGDRDSVRRQTVAAALQGLLSELN